jgi:integrase
LGHGNEPAVKRQIRKAESKPKTKTRADTFAAIIPTYLEARKDGLKPTTYEAQDRHLNTHWKALHDLTLAEMTRANVAAILTEITKARGPIAANRARSTLSKFYVWAIGEGLCDENPVVGTNKRDENDPRERSLSDAEVARVWLDAPDNDYGRILKLILLTGCRRGELGDLKWSEVDREAHTIKLPRERTKNGQEHVVPLSEEAQSIIRDVYEPDREFVFGRTRGGGFSGWSKSKAEFDEIREVQGRVDATRFAPHRSHRTRGARHCAHVAEATLNHLPPKLIRTYDRNTYAAEKRDALDKWAAHLKIAIAQATGANVTSLDKKRRH